MTRERTQSGVNAARRAGSSGLTASRLLTEQATGYQDALATALKRYESRRRPRRNDVTLHIPRRYWPAVHRAAVDLGIPLFIRRLAREQTTPLTIRTSRSGALRLGAAVPELRAGQGPA